MKQNFEKFLYIEKGLQPVTVRNHLKSIERIEKKINLNKENVEDYVFKLYQSNYS